MAMQHAAGAAGESWRCSMQRVQHAGGPGVRRTRRVHGKGRQCVQQRAAAQSRERVPALTKTYKFQHAVIHLHLLCVSPGPRCSRSLALRAFPTRRQGRGRTRSASGSVGPRWRFIMTLRVISRRRRINATCRCCMSSSRWPCTCSVTAAMRTGTRGSS